MILDDMDRISNLPEHIMEKIFFHCLPASDSIRMSFASKTWQRLWKSLPVSGDFDIRRVGQLDESMEESSVTSLDESLRKLHDHEVRKHIIPSFSLNGIFSDEVQTSHVNRWMKLITEQHYVKRLVIRDYANYRIPGYKFPALDFGSLVALSLYNCSLSEDLIQEDMSSFCCLRELELTSVYLNGLIIRDLLSRCPSLEELKLKECKKVEYLELVGFPKLRKLYLYRASAEVFKYKVEASRLKALEYYDRKNPLDLEAVCCSNLEQLQLYTTIVTNQNIKEFIRKFPCLTKLVLDARELKSADIEIKISSRQLKSLAITGDTKNMNIYIDAPNLVSYHREANEITPSFSLNSVKLEKHSHVFCYVSSLHTKWFLKLREYLGKFKPATESCLTLDCRLLKKNISFTFRSLRKEKVPPVPKITKLILDGCSSISDYKALIDGILWSCHPIMIRVPQDGSKSSKPLIKFLYKTLTESEGMRKPSCCEDTHNKCWRNYLKSVNLGPFRTKDGKTAVYSKYSAALLVDSEQVVDATFELRW